MITAVATLVVAITGLVTAITQLGGGEPRTIAMGVTPTAPADETDAQLLSYIPDQVRSTCRRSTDEESQAIAAYNCTYRRIVGLQYNLFASTSELRAGYEDVKRRYGLESADGSSCPSGNFEGVWEPGGSVLCFVGDDGVAAIVWSSEGLDVLSFAWRDDGELAALYDAWKDGVGPER